MFRKARLTALATVLLAPALSVAQTYDSTGRLLTNSRISNGTSFVVPALDTTLTARFPTGSTPADNESNAVTITRSGAFVFVFDGSTWDRWTGAVVATQSGTWNVGTLTTLTSITNPVAVTQSGTWSSVGVTGTFWPTTAAAPASHRLSDGSSFYDAAKTGQLPTALDGSGFLKVHEQGTAAVSGTVTANAGSGTFAVSGPLTDAQLRATAVPVSGTIAATQSGTWTVQPGNTPNTSPWLVSIHDGTTKASVFDLANSNPVATAIVDGTGSQITSFGGGVQYNEGDTDASITGTAVMWEDTADTLRSVSASKPLPVNVVAGGAGDGSILDGVTPSIKASVLDYTDSNPLAVRLTDTNGDYVGASGGTQYAEDTAHVTGDIETMAGVVQQSADSALSGDGDRSLLQVDSSGFLKTTVKSGTVTANAGTGTFTVNGTQADRSAFTDGSGIVRPIAGVYNETASDPTEDQAAAVRITVDRALHVNLRDSTGTQIFSSSTNPEGGSSQNALYTWNQANFTDDSPATVATKAGIAVMGVATADAVDSGDAGFLAMTTSRGLHANLRSASGAEIGTAGSPLRIDPTGSTAQPVTGTFWQATQPVSGTFWPTTAGSPSSARLSDGAAFYDAAKTGQLPVALDGSGYLKTHEQGTATISGTVTANAGTGTFTVGGTVTANQGTAAAASGRWPVYVTDGTNTFPTMDAAARRGYVQVTDGTTNATVIAATAALKTDLSSIAGTATPAGNGTAANSLRVTVASDSTGTIAATQATASSLNVRPDTSGATGAAPPARADFVGGLASGATGGFVVGVTVCDSFANVTVSTATTTLLVTGVSGRHVRICSLSLVTAAANNVALLSGTGATCGTGTTGMSGGTTAATGWNFAANGGLTQGSGIGEVNRTNATGDSVCIVTSAATQLSGRISYTIY